MVEGSEPKGTGQGLLSYLLGLKKRFWYPLGCVNSKGPQRNLPLRGGKNICGATPTKQDLGTS